MNESELRQFVMAYLQTQVLPRMPNFVDHHFRQIKPLIMRHIKYDFIDMLIATNNGFNWLLAGRFSTPSFRRAYVGEAYLNECFMQQCFRPDEFKKAFDQTLFEHAMAQNGLQKHYFHLSDAHQEKFSQQIKDTMNRACACGFVSSKAVALLFDIATATALSGELARGAGAGGGVYIAQQSYIAKASLIKGTWAKIFGVPAWVKTSGLIAGSVLSFIILVPIIGALVEWIAFKIKDPLQGFEENFGLLVSAFIEGDKQQGTTGLLEQSVLYMDSFSDGLDSLKTLMRVL